MAHKTLVNGTAHEISGGKTMVAGTAYTVKSGRTLVGGTGYNLSFLPPVGTTLEDLTWEQISTISAAGLGSVYFSVGDTKSVYISGTVGTRTFNTTLYVYILGFDHNNANNAIDFGTFKTAQTNGKDVCLIDGGYENSYTSSTKYFNMNHGPSNNSGGWKGCDLRYDVLGSTDTYGANAGTTTAISPVANTLMAALPTELRIVMKPMTIYTDNVAGGPSQASNMSASIDYLPLPAEYEIFGKTNYANTAEKNYQKQYEYFSLGNSRFKYKHNSPSIAAAWLTRSPYKGADYFCGVRTDGSAFMVDSSFSFGVWPIFRV